MPALSLYVGLFSATGEMIGKDLEAIVGAAYIDVKENGLEVVVFIFKELGLDTFPLLTVMFHYLRLFASGRQTYCD